MVGKKNSDCNLDLQFSMTKFRQQGNAVAIKKFNFYYY